MMPWLQSMFSDTECCAMRGRPESARKQPSAQFPSPAPRASRHSDHSAGHMSDSFFLTLAEMCANDPQIAVRIEDDRTSPLIWGEARSLRSLFLQMCIRDRYQRCREIWEKLSEFERRDFMDVVQHGPPSHDYFMDIMVHDDQAWKDMSDCGSSSCGRSESRYSECSHPSYSSRRSSI